LHLRLVEVDRGGVGLRVVAPDDLEEPPVARRARVRRDDAVDRVLLRANAGESQLDCHWVPFTAGPFASCVSRTASASRSPPPPARPGWGGRASSPAPSASSSSPSACVPRA